MKSCVSRARLEEPTSTSSPTRSVHSWSVCRGGASQHYSSPVEFPGEEEQHHIRLHIKFTEQRIPPLSSGWLDEVKCWVWDAWGQMCRKVDMNHRGCSAGLSCTAQKGFRWNLIQTQLIILPTPSLCCALLREKPQNLTCGAFCSDLGWKFPCSVMWSLSFMAPRPHRTC